MVAILLQTLPFFALIGLGYGAGRTGFFSAEATGYLTKFVFWFALSAMLFGFAANLSLGEIASLPFVAAYLSASVLVYGLGFAVARARGTSLEAAAMEAHACIIGNVGFLGVPMLVLLLGPAAAGPVLMVLAVDLIVFSSLLTVIVSAGRKAAGGPPVAVTLAAGLARNPMIVSIVLGLAWGATGWVLPEPVQRFLTVLGSAATPCALFAIGASLAGRQAERVAVAGWLAFAKLVLHPVAVAVAAFWLFPVDPGQARVMVAAAALPVAGNVYILAAHFGIAPQRVSSAILISTAASIVTLAAVIAALP